MNAYELADELEECREYELLEFVHKTANMLRQQADKLKKYELRNQEQSKRIAELEKEIKVSYGWNTALTNQLSAQEKQGEPVAKVTEFGIHLEYPLGLNLKAGTKLYATPQTKPLSDEEIMKIIYMSHSWIDGYPKEYALKFARAIEAKVRGQ